MMQNTLRAKLHKVLSSTFVSVFFFSVLIVGMAYAAYRITNTVQDEPDFGGMVTIRQAGMGISGDSEKTKLTRSMIYQYITDEKILKSIASKFHWDVSYKEMLSCIEVKERLSSQNSYFIIANTKNAKRSRQIAKALSNVFLEEYRKIWVVNYQKKIVGCSHKIIKYEEELLQLKNLRDRFQGKNDLNPVSSEIEMKALNEQLIEAQKKFFEEYTAYMTQMEEKRFEFRLKLDLEAQVRTEDDIVLINMRRQMAELDRQCDSILKKMSKQKPDVYRMSADYPKLVDMPNNIIYYYENIHNLQQIKLSMMIGSIIEEKENVLKQEVKKKNTIERLIESNSCDVFLREVGR